LNLQKEKVCKERKSNEKENCLDSEVLGGSPRSLADEKLILEATINSIKVCSQAEGVSSSQSQSLKIPIQKERKMKDNLFSKESNIRVTQIERIESKDVGKWNFPFWKNLTEFIEKANSESLFKISQALKNEKQQDLLFEKERVQFLAFGSSWYTNSISATTEKSKIDFKESDLIDEETMLDIRGLYSIFRVCHCREEDKERILNMVIEY
jgi:hypothetical protein